MVSCRAVVGDTAGNVAEMERCLDLPDARGAHIVCFPECSLTGYLVSADAADLGETIPGPLTRKLEAVCAARGIVVIAGIVERAKSACFLTQVVAGPSGVIGAYRKIHLSARELEYFTPGGGVPLFSWKDFSFGIGLCYDAHFPELATLYALAGADIIFYPHASPPPETRDEKRARWLRYLPARAYDNGVYAAACNQSGVNGRGMAFQGVNLILDPKGRLVSESSGEGGTVASAELSREVLQRVRTSDQGFFLGGRRPDIYGGLVE